MVRGIVVLAVSWACLAGCGADKEDAGAGDDYTDPYMDEPLPPACRETTTGPCETDGEVEDACEQSSDCADGEACLADFDGDRAAFRCVQACVPTLDESQWCTDDTSCCDAAAHCSPRGYCLVD
ncbi:MAG: hypothetical protein U0168_10045 [Nannocystaceae bacterium]